MLSYINIHMRWLLLMLLCFVCVCRVHARHIGHPLLGDDLYGPGHAAAARTVIGKRSSLLAAARAAVEGFARPALHAKTLGFTHPVTRQRLEFDSEWPQDFHQLHQQLLDWQ
jgi:hypothetical protein